MAASCALNLVTISVWTAYLGVLLMTAVLASMSIALLQGLTEWAGAATVSDISNLNDSVFGVVGSLIIMILMVGIYDFCGLLALTCRACGCHRRGSARIWFGMLPGCTFLMTFLVLQTALVLQSSKYLVDDNQTILARLSYNATAERLGEEQSDWVTEMKRMTDLPAFSGSNLFGATTKVAYVTSAAFAVLFLCLLASELTAPCLLEPGEDENAVPLVPSPTYVGRRNSGTKKLPPVAKEV